MLMIGWFKLQLWMWLVDLNYNFKCDWNIKLSENNLASELVENMSFLNQFQSMKFEFLWLILLSFKNILTFSLQYSIFLFGCFVHFKDSSVIC